MFKKLLTLIFLVGLTFTVQAQQTKEDIQKKQQELQKELADLNRSLNEIKKNKKQSIGQLELIKRKINARNELIRNISRDLRLIDDNIYLTTLEINRLKKELDTLKQTYAKSLVFAYKNRSNYDYLNFLFSATNFNDAIKRMAYLKSYRQYRETQVNNINKTQTILEQKAGILSSSKLEKNTNIQEQNKQLTVLQDDRKEQDMVVQQLKGQESDLAKEIRNKENTRKKLQQSLAAIIRRELEEARKKEKDRLARLAAEEKRRKQLEDQKRKEQGGNIAKTNPPDKEIVKNPTITEPATNVGTSKKPDRTYSPFESTTEGLSLSLNFEANRGKLPWPVSAGYISIHFGSYEIPGTKLKGVSDGIEISLPVGASVKAVADGEVSSVFDLGGGEQAVIIRHGKYFTTYSHLASVSVNVDQKVSVGTVLGRAAAGENGEGQVLFMVTNDKSVNLNPESWLRKK